MTARTTIPLATYRLQFSTNFTFRDAIGILDYLRDLGISHVYASPAFTSRHGSGHGYDVTDPTRIDTDLGSEEAFDEFLSAVEQRGMGVILDIVPNHMAASTENRWWMDVLEFGPASPFAPYFDINWRPPSQSLENKLLLPFLAKPFGEVLDGGELRLTSHEGRFFLHYQEQRFPLAPRSYIDIIRSAESHMRNALPSDSPGAQEWQGILAAAELLGSVSSFGAQAAAEIRARLDALRERMRVLLAGSPEIAVVLEKTLQSINGIPGAAQSFTALERILAAQHYRLAFWQTASDSINYRRFFSITDLVGVRVEDPAVFDATHEAIIRAAQKPAVSGLRIDHIDGLRDPRAYLNRLRERLSQNGVSQNGAAHNRSPERSTYLVVEKILARGEWPPTDWPIDGTTGYDYLNFANRLLVDDKQAAALQNVYARWLGESHTFENTLYQKKKLVMRTLLGVEMRSLGRDLAELASSDRYARELGSAELTEALIETTACLCVYRTYIQTIEVPEEAQSVLTEAIRSARERRPQLSAALDFVSDVLLLKSPDHVRADQREARLAFVGRWQQFTGSIMAKGFEDTALYVYFPLASLNEVGGDPRCLSSSEHADSKSEALAFHRYIALRNENWPFSMNATTTHDTKRSEDTRARIAVLSEIPAEWEPALAQWSQQNARYIRQASGGAVPERNEEYFFYQTLIGAWPLSYEEENDKWPTLIERLQEYMIKATREASIRTRWTRPNEAHESALRNFVAAVLDREKNSDFCKDFDRFQQRTALYGMLNGLAQALLKVVVPGVPDTYQGSELWDLRLVDPDNRGPIDFALRTSMLDSVHHAPNRECVRFAQDLLANWRDGRAKLHVLARALNARYEDPSLFLDGDYLPLEASDRHRDRVVAFARHLRGNAHDRWAIAVVPRCVAALQAPVISGSNERRAFWAETSLALPENVPSSWTNVLAGQGSPQIRSDAHRLSLGDAFANFPIALLFPASH